MYAEGNMNEELRPSEMTAEETIELVLKRPGMYGLVPHTEHRSMKAERDAALAAIGRVAEEIQAVAGGLTSSSEAAGYRNGLLRAAQIVRAALDRAPEPEEKP